MAIFNMVGGGGGGLKSTDAILRVIAPAGSTVTISKGGVSKSDLGHENASDPTLYDYYFIIHESQFDSVNPWTVTATLGTQSIRERIIIDSANEYDLVISYELHLVIDGVTQDGSFVALGMKTSSSSTASATTPSVTQNAGYITIGLSASSGTGTGIVYLPNQYDLANYSTVRIVGEARCGFDTLTNLAFDAWTELGTYQSDNRLIQSNLFTSPSTAYVAIDLSIDISSLTDDAYIGFNFGKSSSNQTYIRLEDMWLEA